MRLALNILGYHKNTLPRSSHLASVQYGREIHREGYKETRGFASAARSEKGRDDSAIKTTSGSQERW